MNKTKQRTWIITGGANGIGQCLVSDLALKDEKVVFLDNDEKNANKTLKKCRNLDVTYIKCDLSSEDSMHEAVIKLKEVIKEIDVIVHNAAINKGGLMDATYDDFMDTLKVNVGAPFYLSKALIRFMNNQTSIVLIASTRALQSQKNTESYSASKGALLSLTHAMAMTLSGKARVNSISPGWIDTISCDHENHRLTSQDHAQIPSKRVGTPMDIIKAIYFLSDPSNDFINAQNIVIDGGMHKQMIYHNDEGWQFHT